MQAQQRYWFPAKQYGWGWGLPIAWQGWLVLVAFFALLVAGAFAFLPRQGALAFVAFSFALSIALVAICYAKGEPPAWRWGRR